MLYTIPAGLFGTNCDRRCPQHCSGGHCHRIFGYCECLPGLFGTACNQPCPAGTWGPNCIHMCNCSAFEHASGCDPKVCICRLCRFSGCSVSVNLMLFQGHVEVQGTAQAACQVANDRAAAENLHKD